MRNIVKKLFYLLPPGDSRKVVVLFMGMMLVALLEVIGLGMIPVFVSIVASPNRVLEFEKLQPVLSFFEITTSRDLLLWGSLALVVVFIIKSGYIISFNYFEAKFVYHRRYIISLKLMNSYMQAPYTFHLQRNTAELMRNIINEINILINNVFNGLLRIAREGVLALSVFIFLLVLEPVITALILCISVIGAGSFMLFTQKRVKSSGIELQRHRSEMIKTVNQGLGGIKDARILNREQEFIEAFRIEAFKSTRIMAFIRFIQQIPKPIVETTAVFGMMLIAALMVWQGRPMSAIIPILTLFAMATMRLMPSIQQLSSEYTTVRHTLVSIDPVYNDLKELEQFGKKFRSDRQKIGQLKLRETVEAKDIYYRYPSSDEQALRGVSFTIPKGKAVAFVGASGAGKTTVVDLLLGLLEPVSGTIMVDGQNIQESLSAWQRNIGYIPQFIYLSDETLRSNIAFGIARDEIDEEKIREAVELAQLGNLVKSLPDGLDTIIGEHGTRLSGGQRQRVGIARALYHNPQVLVMDEATSALDNVTEKRIIRSIEALKGERTVVMIAHRLTTVQNCDCLYMMDSGVIVDSGQYDELILRNAEFRKMALVD